VGHVPIRRDKRADFPILTTMRLKKTKSSNTTVVSILREHFGSRLTPEQLVTASRIFPATAHVDLQIALDAVFSSTFKPERFVGIHYGWCAPARCCMSASGPTSRKP